MSSLRVVIEVIEGRELPACDSNGLSDPYCVIVVGGQHKRTKIIKKTLNPKWNEIFEFLVPAKGNELEVILHVYDYDKWSTDDYMGDVVVSFSPINSYLDTTTEQWIPLKNKKMKTDKLGEIHLKASLSLVASDKLRKFKLRKHNETLSPQTLTIPPRSMSLSSDRVPQQIPSSPHQPSCNEQFKPRASSVAQLDAPSTALIEAVLQDNADLVHELLILATPTELNARDSNGYSALHHACVAKDNPNQDRIVTTLLSFDAIDVKIPIETDRNTPLHYFCQNFSSPDCSEPFNLFIQRGADVNARNTNGETPLFKAIFNKVIRILLVEHLIESGALVNVYNSQGEGPLHYAVRLKRSDLVSVLLKAGADVNVVGLRSKKTPLQLAEEDPSRPEIISTLRNAQKISEWLSSLKLEKYVTAFLREELTEEHLADIDEVLLERMSISNPDRQTILNAVQPLKKTPSAQEKKALKQEESAASELSRIVAELEKVNPNKGDWAIDSNELEYTKKLGSGTSGDVYTGFYKGKPVAIKLLKEMMIEKEIEEFKKEFAIMSTLRKSQYVVYFFGAALTPKLCMVMELCSRGSLYHVLNDETYDIGWKMFFSLYLRTIQGIHVLHTNDPQIMHRDLKSLNLLVTKDWEVKVCDFGLSRFDTAENIQTMSKMRGTMAFCAPEVYLGQRFTTKSDVYSLGIVMWEIVTRVINRKYETPYSEYKHLQFDFQIIIQAAHRNLRPSIPPTCPSGIADLMRQCMEKTAEPRPSTEELLERLTTLQAEYDANTAAWDSTILAAPKSD